MEEWEEGSEPVSSFSGDACPPENFSDSVVIPASSPVGNVAGWALGVEGGWSGLGRSGKACCLSL